MKYTEFLNKQKSNEIPGRLHTELVQCTAGQQYNHQMPLVGPKYKQTICRFNPQI